MNQQHFGKYKVVDKIGEGGFGEVFKGRDPHLKRPVAIKTCKAADPGLVERFLREAEIVASLQHPNITTVYDFGHEEGTPYLVQEYLNGEDLDHKIRRLENIPLDTRVRYLVEAARGLQYAHSRGVIHRDIKPSNLRILDDGGVKIMDFGIAKLLGAERDLTQTGTTMGTAGYLPPEQLRGEAVDLRADIFSFGVTAYELLGARRPFDGDSFATICHQILHVDPPPLSALSCPPALAKVIARCLRKNPAERYASFDEIITALEGGTSSPEPNEAITVAGAGSDQPTVALPRASGVPGTDSVPRVARSDTGETPPSWVQGETPAAAHGGPWWRGIAALAIAALLVLGFFAWRGGFFEGFVDGLTGSEAAPHGSPTATPPPVGHGQPPSTLPPSTPPVQPEPTQPPPSQPQPTQPQPIQPQPIQPQPIQPQPTQPPPTQPQPQPIQSAPPPPVQPPSPAPVLPTPPPSTEPPPPPRVAFPLNADEKPIPVAVLPLGLSATTRDLYPQLAERQVGFGLHNLLVDRLYDTGWFRFVEARPEVEEELVKRHWMAASGAVTKESAIELGRVLGARYVAYGEVFDFGTQPLRRKESETRIAIQIRLVDVETFEFVPASGKSTLTRKGAVFPGEVELARSTVGAVSEEALKKAVEQLIDRVVPKV